MPEATVRSPDFVPDRDTGQSREVDVGIHVPRNGGSTFIAIECRDRKAVQNVEWVEQLICKKQSIGADVLVAITSSRFYRPARIKALKHGVILARMTSKLPEEIGELAKSFFITFQFVAPRILEVDLQLPSHLIEDPDAYRYPTTPIFHAATLESSGTTRPGCSKTCTAAMEPSSASSKPRADFLDLARSRTAKFFAWGLRACGWAVRSTNALRLPPRLRTRRGPDLLAVTNQGALTPVILAEKLTR